MDVDEAETLRLKEEWERANIPVPLTVVASPYREITRPVIGYVKRLRRESPRDIVTVYIPEYVLGSLVGAVAAQPERAAAEVPAAAAARRGGGQRALPAAVRGASLPRRACQLPTTVDATPPAGGADAMPPLRS